MKNEDDLNFTGKMKTKYFCVFSWNGVNGVLCCIHY